MALIAHHARRRSSGSDAASVRVDEDVAECRVVCEHGRALQPILVFAALDLGQDQRRQDASLVLRPTDARGAQQPKCCPCVTASADGTVEKSVDPFDVSVSSDIRSNPNSDPPPFRVGRCVLKDGLGGGSSSGPRFRSSSRTHRARRACPGRQERRRSRRATRRPASTTWCASLQYPRNSRRSPTSTALSDHRPEPFRLLVAEVRSLQEAEDAFLRVAGPEAPWVDFQKHDRGLDRSRVARSETFEAVPEFLRVEEGHRLVPVTSSVLPASPGFPTLVPLTDGFVESVLLFLDELNGAADPRRFIVLIVAECQWRSTTTLGDRDPLGIVETRTVRRESLGGLEECFVATFVSTLPRPVRGSGRSREGGGYRRAPRRSRQSACRGRWADPPAVPPLDPEGLRRSLRSWPLPRPGWLRERVASRTRRP